MLIFERERERERMSREGAESEGDRGSLAGSVLTAEKPNLRLELTNYEIMTRAKVRCLTT